MGSMSTIAGVTAENLAQRFTPHVPMQASGISPERAKVWLDVPKRLAEGIGSGKVVISTTCLVANAKLAIGLYEDICLNHVIDMQIQDKTLSKLMRPNRAIEAANPDEHGLDEPGKRIARSSFLGQDPYGDEEVPDDPDADEDDETYTRMQTLLKRIQDDNYLYLTTHFRRILHRDIFLNVKNEEAVYEADTRGVRSATDRNRMPWARYKTVVIELLPIQVGLHELRIMMTINRENYESVHSWLQRLTEGKRVLEEHGITLPDAIYAQLAIDYLTNKEKTDLTAKVGSPHQRSIYTKLKLKRMLYDQTFDKINKIVRNTLGFHSDYRLTIPNRLLKQVVFTEAQARKYLEGGHKPQAKAAPKKRKRETNQSAPKGPCDKCTKAGLRGRRAAHKTEDCVKAIRDKNVRKLKEHQQKKLAGNQPAKRARAEVQKPSTQKKVSFADLECGPCKKAGRKHRHDPRKCKFAPGGEWHGKSKEELRALQKQFYEKINQSRQVRTLTHQINQRKKHKKTCRGELKSDSSSEDSGVPLWRKEVTLIAMMNHPNCQNESGSNTPGDNNRNIALENEPSQIHITPGVESMVTASSSSEGEDPIGSGEAADEEAPEESNVIGPKEETETTPSCTPGVAGQKPGGEASEATKKGKFPKIMDDQPTKSVAVKSSEAAAKADVEVIDLTATSSEEADAKEPVEAGAENPEEGPMTTKEFLEKRAEMRRKEWTNAKEQVNMEKEQSGTETEPEPEPVMFTGITFNGPPLFGPLRAESMPAKLMDSENAGSAGKAMRDKIHAMMPVCYMMNEAPSAGDIPETPMPPPVQHPSDEEDYAMMMFYVYACASNGKPFPPATPVRYPMFLDETMKRGLFRELKYDFPLEHGQWQVMVKGKALKKEDTPHSLHPTGENL